MGLTDSYAYFLPVHALYQIVSIKLCHDSCNEYCYSPLPIVLQQERDSGS